MELNPGAPVSVTGAMAHYESLRRRHRSNAGLTRTEAINSAMTDLWVELLTPYRVFSESLTPDGVIRWHVVSDYSLKDSGIPTPLWMMRGNHRERDAVRLSVVLRNQFVLGVRQGRVGYPWTWPAENVVERRGWLIQHLNSSYPEPADI